MGSSGSGRISDYPGTGGRPGSKSGGAGDPVGSGDRCSRAFTASLEDIEHSDYFEANGVVPPIGQSLRIAQRKRLVAETGDGQSVGNLPTSLNYLAACLKDGWTYTGVVTACSNGPPVAAVMGDFAANPPA
jgi:hypothetical protein